MKSNASKFQNGESVQIVKTGESVTIMQSKYIKNMHRYSYILKEYPSTFYFEEELNKDQ
ncbi:MULTISPECIES: hypothetical protein [Bacillaceae]|jgi:hypothetical protein|uniref:hypothetical protein n=1 Tax=Bacillaceae TaxID=186817 RepID=UPI001404574E|nr:MULTISPECIES: hypothetical protein [Bacillaceae]MCM3596848.1 hypothetical protein [Metabacillus idriensis]MDR0139695.1 hypothetical protein [Metabacillus idriensis]